MTSTSRSPSRKSSKAKSKGMFARAIRQSFIKLDPRIAIKNPVMFIVWIGTIVTALMTIDPNIFGNVTGGNLRLFNGLICVILFATVLFANFAEAFAEGRGKAQADSLRATKSDTMARKVADDGSLTEVSSTSLRRG
ncbi:MAG: hypothetical protein RLZZ135_1323, partial [Cyanobacteriota bacterium]